MRQILKLGGELWACFFGRSAPPVKPQLQNFRFSDQLPGHLVLARHGTGLWATCLQVAQGSPVVRWLAAAVVVTGMVLLFHAVVTQSVHQSGLRQQALAVHARAVQRCQLLAKASARRSCLLELAARPPVTLSLPGAVSR